MNNFFERRFIIQAIFVIIALILLIQIFFIQIVTNKYSLSANSNVLRKNIIYPARGIILDRKEKILVQNEPVYDLMIIPNKVKPFDTLVFCRLKPNDIHLIKHRFLRNNYRHRCMLRFKSACLSFLVFSCKTEPFVIIRIV